MKIEMRVLVRKAGDWWVVRGIDKDIASQAREIGDALYDFERVLMGHIFLDIRAGREPLADIPAAPKELEDQWRRGVGIKDERPRPWESRIPVSLPPIDFEMRVA